MTTMVHSMKRTLSVLGVLTCISGMACTASTDSAPGNAAASLVATTPKRGGGPPPTTPPEPPPGKTLEVRTYASAIGNSYLIAGKKEAILIDSQYTKHDVSGLVEWLRESKKTLKTVFLTHAHPDHYYGFDAIKKAFPETSFVAIPGVVAEFEASAQSIFEGQKDNPDMTGLLPDALVAPTPFTDDKLVIEGQELPVVPLAHPGESTAAAVIELPSENAVIGGDAFMNHVHLWLAECASEGWLTDLATLKTRGYKVLYPGHGPAGGPEILDENIAYIHRAIPALNAAESPDEAGAALRALFPDWGGADSPFFMMGIGFYFEACKAGP
jgi:glyoxylase-like metal-dependent hydrolase (beta-lactamase superfamily II)